VSIRLDDFLKIEAEKVPFIVGRGVLPKKGKLILGGQPKANKSFVVLNMALAIARGKPLFNGFYKNGTPVLPVTHPYRVQYLEMELGQDGLQTRLRGLVGEEDASPLDIFVKTRDTAMRLDTPEGEEFIKREVAEGKPDVLIIDPLAKFHVQDENSAQEMSYVIRKIDHLVEDFNCSVIVVHHLKKPNTENPARGGDRLRGSSAIFADVDTLMEVERLSNETVKEPILKVTFELRRGEPLEPLFLKRLKSGGVMWMGEDFIWGGSEREYTPSRRTKRYSDA
jgi:RecA-family ATPase